mgnify:CR=1 FL=1
MLEGFSLSRPCFQIIVVSDSVAEGLQEDISGELAKRVLVTKGFCVSSKVVVRNSYREILKALRSAESRVLVFLGGTGPGPRDITVDVIERVSWRCLPGFGEIFRKLAYEKIGGPAILTRTALCVLHDGKIAVALPGSPDAVSLGLDLLAQVVEHLIEEVDRFEGPHKLPR